MTEPSPASSPTWRSAPSEPGPGGKASRRLRLLLVAGAALALAGALIGWLFYVRPFHKAHFLPLCLNEYGGEVPVRAWARQDAELLRSLDWHERNTFTAQKRDLLVRELRDFTRSKVDGPLVVYLSAYARTTPQGELCILPVGASLDEPASWLPLREVFEHLRASKAAHKLLLLDIMQPFTDARSGVLLNDSAEHLQPLLEEVLGQDPNLSVLCACSPGQLSLVAEELGHSVFAYFLDKALRGQAEGEGPRRTHDGRVSLRELAAFVTGRVEEWALQHRNARQTPRLYGANRDYPLVGVGSTEGAGEEPSEAAYPEWLSEGWKLRDSWFDDETYRVAPRTFRQLEAALLRAEQEWRGGVRVERIRQDLAGRREQLERERSEQMPAGDEPTSLAGGRPAPQPASEDTVVSLRQLAARYARASTSKPDEAEKTKIDAEAAQLLKQFQGKPLELARAAFAAAQTEDAPPAALRFLVDLLRKAKAPSYAETRLLARLAELPAASADWPAESVLLALRTVGAAEKVAAGDPRALPWVQEARADADRRRREGETLLFSAEASARRRAADPLRRALQAYQAIVHDLQAVEQAQRYRDELLVRLPSYPPCLEIDDETEEAWKNAAATLGTLRQLLAGPGPSPCDSIRRLDELTSVLRNDPNNLQRLRRPLDPEPLEKLIGRSQAGNAVDAKLMTALLATPWPRADQRARLWTAWHELTIGLEKAPLQGTPPPPWDEGKAVVAERRRGLRRARLSLEVLRIEGGHSIATVEKSLQAAIESPDDMGRIRALEVELRRAWSSGPER
jgi:hypothetical protein